MMYEYYVLPYFTVTYNCIDEDGNTLQTAATDIMAGNSYNLIVPRFEGLTVTSNDAYYSELAKVQSNIDITIIYGTGNTDIKEIISEKNSSNNLYYDMFGQPYKTPMRKGIYIHRGKKIVIK